MTLHVWSRCEHFRKRSTREEVMKASPCPIPAISSSIVHTERGGGRLTIILRGAYMYSYLLDLCQDQTGRWNAEPSLDREIIPRSLAIVR